MFKKLQIAKLKTCEIFDKSRFREIFHKLQFCEIESFYFDNYFGRRLKTCKI